MEEDKKAGDNFGADSKNKIEIIPTVMPDSYEDFFEKIGRVAPFVRIVQIDVMDGKFVPSTSWPYSGENFGANDESWQNLINQEEGIPHWQEVEFEVDLMVEDQIGEAKNWISAGVGKVICHVEALDPEKIDDFLALKEEFGAKLSLALVPSTPNSALDPYIEHLDSVQFMGIQKIGFQGQEFAPEVLEKITELRSKKPDLPIEVDGGVSFDTARRLVNAGATHLASGSTIFKAENTERVINDLKNTANS